MTHAKRHLIGALLTALAIAALAAPGAGAAELTAFNTTTGVHESARVRGDQVETILFTAGSGVGSMTCAQASAEGFTATGTETELTLTPTYSECHVVLLGTTYTVHVAMNGCDYRIPNQEGKEGPDVYSGNVDILCPAGQEIDIKMTKSGSEETKCTIQIPAQNGVKTGTVENVTSASPTHIVTRLNFTNIQDKTTGGLLGCGIANGTHTNGTLTGSTTAKAYNTAGSQIDLTIMD